ncbi:Glutamate receptor 2.7 [Vitis vinifera]|uniref:Glutamate receptor n=1 Tax=Vitis vinifera TaxID=29760 RepID=A0A438E5K8_VITVI|nr:Glutamate receptor 2.7 [Vitis vinifera]
MAWVLLLSPAAAAADHGGTSHSNDSIGVIVDYGSRVGKEEKVAMELAIDDFYKKTNQRLVLHSRDSQGDPLRARISAMDLIEKQQVQAIVGLHTWEEVSLVAEVGGHARIPILSLADSTPKWATDRWPFLVQASPSRYLQMNAVAAIVGSWQWRWITVIYEDTDSAATDIIPCLADALKQVGSEIGYLLALPPFTVNSSSPLSGELEGLKGRQSRVFVLHSSLSMAEHLFETANELGMMEEGYVWIITDRTTNLIHSMNSAIISSMQGILGVRSYFSQSGPRFQDFYLRFREKFHSLYPKEGNHEPGIFALQAYDAVWSVALAMEKASSSKKGFIQPFLERIAISDFHGLNSRIQFNRRSLAPQRIFQIINVIGKSYRELGFWFEGSGFSKTTNEKSTYSRQLQVLGQVLWPGGPWSVPRGWSLPTSQKPLRIGVPQHGTFKQFVNVTYDGSHYSVTGFSIEVFNATLEHLKYHLPYELIPYSGNYDSLVEQVHLKEFDAVVGDISIISKRWEHADFTHPTANLDCGCVVWLIERNHTSAFEGSILSQTATLLCMSFTTLFSLHGEKLHSNLSRLSMVVWLFVALVITQSYTANLSTLLTVQKLKPSVKSLKDNNFVVGCSLRSFIPKYLEEVLGIDPKNIKDIRSFEEYPQAFRRGEIAATFMESLYAEVFLAQYCKGFVTVGPTFRVGGLGFVFPKGSTILPDISEAVVKLYEKGEIMYLRNKLVHSQKCLEVEAEDDHSISPDSVWVLFLATGATSTVSLAIYVAGQMQHFQDFMLENIGIWRLISAAMRSWMHHHAQRTQFSGGDLKRTSSLVELGTYRGSHGNV